ncbi:hypothetical protein [Uliginosibacterium gangwonense]|uniref:hypothetical protein n=1 Tax=Uliginosibacterium gangwonense TaxID=392736 RepID=UPI000371A1F3|nr:hypothetical protein [Uliginosibacterium gangwonense]
MKIIVALKRVPSQQVQIRALTDGSAADLTGGAMIINPFVWSISRVYRMRWPLPRQT